MASVEDLEAELERIQAEIVAEKNAEYIASTRFTDHINWMKTRCPVTYGQSAPETMEEVVSRFILEFTKVNQAYTDALWSK
jgi:hypothetical protein